MRLKLNNSNNTQICNKCGLTILSNEHNCITSDRFIVVKEGDWYE